MQSNQLHSHSWRGDKLRVEIPYTRAGVAQHVVISGGQTCILIDAGDGVLRDLLAGDLSPQDIDAVFFTHGHYDHMGGLHTLLGFMRMIGRTEPLLLGVPPRCTEVLAAARTFMECYPESIPFQIEVNELPPSGQVNIGEMEVTSYPVVHCGSIVGAEVLDPIPAVGYRIGCGGETVAVTGDTGMCPQLEDIVRDADLAVIEATYESSEGRSRELLEKVHLSEDLARPLGDLAKEYILVHKGRRRG
ncbi:MAG: ribonuclease Z [Candidatus Zixiibacteriota bacterium]|nr:MAG: ribonuclease Z [candidate division Zixibacteria bacterium]